MRYTFRHVDSPLRLHRPAACATLGSPAMLRITQEKLKSTPASMSWVLTQTSRSSCFLSVFACHFLISLITCCRCAVHKLVDKQYSSIFGSSILLISSYTASAAFFVFTIISRLRFSFRSNWAKSPIPSAVYPPGTV